MSGKKPTLGLIETITLDLPDGKSIKLKAKIDTGAHYTALDLSLAKKLGYEKSIKQFNKTFPKFKITKKNFKSIKNKINRLYKKEFIEKIPGLVDIKLIPATNGFSIRPYFKVQFKLKNKTIKTKVSLVDRSHMKFPFLVGKADIKGFLIDPAKNIYYTL